MRALESKQVLKMSSFGMNTRMQTDKRRRAQELSAANREENCCYCVKYIRFLLL